jgi:hypothetical protein
MGLKFILGLIVLVVLIEMILTIFNVPIFEQDYTPILRGRFYDGHIGIIS